MNDYPSNVKQKLNSIISDISEHHRLFSNNPGHDFMRQHHCKLSFYDTMCLIIGIGKCKAQSDVYRYINPSKNTSHFYELLHIISVCHLFTSFHYHIFTSQPIIRLLPAAHRVDFLF